MFLCIIFIWPCDLDLWPVDFGDVRRIKLRISSAHTNFYHPTFIRSWVMCDSITLPSLGTVTAHAPCHVTYHRGKNYPHFWNPWIEFTYSLCHLYFATTKIKPCYRRKIAFSYCEGNKVNCACAVSRDLCTGSPPKPHETFFWPRLVYSLYNFYGATMTIKCDLTLSTSPSNRAPSSQRLLSATSVCCLMASSQCASKCPGCHRHAFITYAAYVP